MTALYEIKHAYIESARKLQDLDLDAQTIIDTLDSMSGELEEKAVNTIMVCRNLKSTAIAIKEAETAMSVRRKAIEKRAEYLENNVFQAMLDTGISKIECPYFQLSIAKNPQSTHIYELGLIPAEYMREIPATEEPDKKLIADAIKAGFEVPGAKLVQSVRLVVK